MFSNGSVFLLIFFLTLLPVEVEMEEPEKINYAFISKSHGFFYML